MDMFTKVTAFISGGALLGFSGLAHADWRGLGVIAPWDGSSRGVIFPGADLMQMPLLLALLGLGLIFVAMTIRRVQAKS